MPAFQNILLPVDFSENTELAIKKAIDFVDKDISTINLLHVRTNKRKWNKDHFDEDFRVEQLTKFLQFVIPNTIVNTDIINKDSIEEAIEEKANLIKADLIIIAKHSNKKIFSFKKKIFPDSLAAKTKCAVLTVKPGCLENNIKSIVIPIRSCVPKRKLETLTLLTWKKKITVYLLSMVNPFKEYDEYESALSHTLVETYRILKGEVNCQIFHEIISGDNVAKTALHFAERVNADVLLTNPDEINISSFAKLDITDRLMRNSKLQLLTVASDNSYQ